MAGKNVMNFRNGVGQGNSEESRGKKEIKGGKVDRNTKEENRRK